MPHHPPTSLISSLACCSLSGLLANCSLASASRFFCRSSCVSCHFCHVFTRWSNTPCAHTITHTRKAFRNKKHERMRKTKKKSSFVHALHRSSGSVKQAGAQLGPCAIRLYSVLPFRSIHLHSVPFPSPRYLDGGDETHVVSQQLREQVEVGAGLVLVQLLHLLLHLRQLGQRPRQRRVVLAVTQHGRRLGEGSRVHRQL